MRTNLLALALVALSAGALPAQSVTVRSQLGAYAPFTPLVSVADGYNNNVELEPAPAIGLGIDVALHRDLSLYGGVQASFTRLSHSSVMELRDVDGAASSRVNLLVPTGGLLYAPTLGTSPIRPLIRVGAGVKLYDFDLYDVNKLVSNFVGDAGVGFSAGSGPISLTTEARWLPSRFDARTLPIRLIGNATQNQNDWVFLIGFTIRPSAARPIT